MDNPLELYRNGTPSIYTEMDAGCDNVPDPVSLPYGMILMLDRNGMPVAFDTSDLDMAEDLGPMSMSLLAGKVCVVTGATRGIGKGVALQLAEQGAKVFITGRTLKPRQGSDVGGSLQETVREARERGGMCVAITCDHSKEADIERLFETVKTETDGQLDILVNNAFSATNTIISTHEKPFYEFPISVWDDFNNNNTDSNNISETTWNVSSPL
ncbi:DHRS1-like protein [Mya arenaria]|uniref:DHRS1-like protein n=1 Tax=Mya arenaria TaxID=6604 RepID=A0ABY7GD76_MYAAR|nr:DHRS1-like protein [Mya arenaria]